MSVVSMTGFAETHGAHESVRWRWEVKSVNGRGLDLRLRMPPGFDSIDIPARTLAGERFRRGNIQANLTIEPQEGARGFRVDPEALAAAVKIARQVSAETGLAPARVDGLLGLKGILIQDDVVPSGPAERAARDAALLETLATAFDALRRARRNEGAKLTALLNGMIAEIERLTREAASLAATQPAALRDRLVAQMRELLESTSISEERLAQEVALLAGRADVREELDRLAAHVHEARALIDSGDAIGRKLDFLAQEFNREANTLCSKSADIQLTRTGLALKSAIEQFREQAQNVE
ncbi:MAG TPA: YicC/YloC family endoribonuclease [Rhizomicrobium sp.]|nr:YicC/YloC family endoribonuclease [Rhizomicrobium sp.]